MILRVAKILLVAAIAFFYTLVIFNNLTDYNSNYLFVHHVLLMDTTFPGNHGMWRAIHPHPLQIAFYDGIIAWESLTTVFAWIGVVSYDSSCPGSPMARSTVCRSGRTPSTRVTACAGRPVSCSDNRSQLTNVPIVAAATATCIILQSFDPRIPEAPAGRGRPRDQ